MNAIRVSVLVSLCLFSVACPEAYEEGEDPSAEACEHASEGPFNDAAASAVADSTAGDVTAEHTLHEVTLTAIEGGNGGFVQLESEGGEHIVFLSKDVPVTFEGADGAAIEPEERVTETECPEIVVAHHVVFPVGIVRFSFGPTEEATVSLLVEPAGEHED